MKEADRKARNVQRMTTLYPTFAARLSKVIEELEAGDLRPRIQDAWRSRKDQIVAFNAGHTKLKYGFHNVTGPKGEKESLAVDLLDDDAPLNPGTPYVLRLTAAAEKHGLTTGARWGVPIKMRQAIDKAIFDKNWDAPVKVGWDPVHVEPTGITVAKAKAGKRPS